MSPRKTLILSFAALVGLMLAGLFISVVFDRWLVLELSDGRLAYIPPSAIKYLEQASNQAR
jgi:hypothetical protein